MRIPALTQEALDVAATVPQIAEEHWRGIARGIAVCLVAGRRGRGRLLR